MAEDRNAQALVARFMFASAFLLLMIAGLVSVYGEVIGLDADTAWIVALVLMFAAASDAIVGQFLKMRSERVDRG